MRALLAVLLLVACGEEDLKEPLFSEGLAACVNDSVDGEPKEGLRCHTYRGIGGVSMGGGSAARFALGHPELFDVVTSLGAPYLDLEYFLWSVSKTSNGGFCELEQILAHLDEIDVKDHPDLWCGPNPLNDLAVPDTECRGFAGDFNHHYRGTDAGRGGSFNREGSFKIVQDFALAYGNPAFYNPDSPYLPPGVSEDFHVSLELSKPGRQEELQARRRELCERPQRIEGFFDATYNPRGEYPVITFCDGDGPVNGEYEPGVADFPVEVVVSVDYNDNGRRDWGEPVLAQPLEIYQDVGPDGLPSSLEPGFDPGMNPDPNGDDYDWLLNPLGGEGNSRFEPGEPFDDFGLDGVAGTGDFGEGNGKWDLNPNVEHAFASSPRKLVEGIDERMLSRLQIWADAGIRDFLHTAQITNQFWGSLRRRVQPSNARMVLDWDGLAGATGQSGEFDPYLGDFSEDTLGRHVYLRYGDTSVCPDVDWENGRGNHVGPAWEILNRLLSALAFASARLEGGDFSALGGSLADQRGPTGSLSDFVLVESYQSAALGREQPFVVVLPPDYYLGQQRYPVFYFLHGQGQKATDLAASALLFLGPQMGSQDQGRSDRRLSDWQKMILVFADGECPAGECHTGTFYLDFVGLEGAGPRHGEAFFELMREVDRRYRVKTPQMEPL